MDELQLIESEKTDKSGFSLEEKLFVLSNGEKVVLPSMKINHMNLFHGSVTPGITIFQKAEESTIGEGLYLTSQKDAAIGYAYIRAGNKKLDKPPIIYETEISNMNILSLTTREAIRDFMKFFRQELNLWWKSDFQRKLETAPETDKWNYLSYDRIIKENLDKLDSAIRTGQVLTPKEIIWNFQDTVKEILTKNGFDGIMTVEGGEHGRNPFNGESMQIGDHDSYVIFDPERVKVVKEETHSYNQFVF